MANAGQRVGEYVLDEIAGRGAFGEVWRARHHVWTDRVVAIKLPTDPAYLGDLQREGVNVPQLDHPGIVKALGFDPYANPPYLAMEFVKGASLRPAIKSGALTQKNAVEILGALLAALEHAHGAGVVHRDIKPENVLIDLDRAAKEGYDAPGVVKLTDFGLGQSSRATSTNSIAMSINPASPAARELVGTIDYMSPEQRAGGDVDARTDLYACGIMLFEMLTGERPAGTEVPSELKSDVPSWLDDVYRKAVARRENRFARAADMRNALRRESAPPPLPGRSTVVTPASGNRKCPRCAGPVGRDDQFCIHCGVQIVQLVRRCAGCGSYPSPQDRFCIQCGSSLSASPAMA